MSEIHGELLACLTPEAWGAKNDDGAWLYEFIYDGEGVYGQVLTPTQKAMVRLLDYLIRSNPLEREYLAQFKVCKLV